MGFVGFGKDPIGELIKALDMFAAAVALQKIAKRLFCLVDDIDDENAAALEKTGVGSCILDHVLGGGVHEQAGRKHHIDRHEQGNAVQHLVRRRLLYAKRLPEQGKTTTIFMNEVRSMIAKGKSERPAKTASFVTSDGLVVVSSSGLNLLWR